MLFDTKLINFIVITTNETTWGHNWDDNNVKNKNIASRDIISV